MRLVAILISSLVVARAFAFSPVIYGEFRNTLPFAVTVELANRGGSVYHRMTITAGGIGNSPITNGIARVFDSQGHQVHAEKMVVITILREGLGQGRADQKGSVLKLPHLTIIRTIRLWGMRRGSIVGYAWDPPIADKHRADFGVADFGRRRHLEIENADPPTLFAVVRATVA